MLNTFALFKFVGKYIFLSYAIIVMNHNIIVIQILESVNNVTFQTCIPLV
jgi:hypothetical protein